MSLCVSLWISNSLLGQNTYRLTGRFENGNTIQENEVFYLNDIGMFNMVDEQNETIVFKSCWWSVEVLDENNDRRVLSSNNVTKDFTFSLNKEAVSTTLLAGLQRISYKDDLNVYHMAKIICYGETADYGIITDTMNIRLNILPAKPQLEISGFTGGQAIGEVEFKIEQKRHNEGVFIETVYDEYGPWSTTSYTLSGLSDILFFQLLINCPMLNMYAEYKVYSCNDFGMVESDILRLDDEIIKDLIASGNVEIESLGDITVFPNPTNGLFSIITERLDIERLFVLNQYGQTMRTIDNPCNVKTIDVSDLPNGHYLICLVTAENKQVRTIKIFKY